jgi:hypothetical protein
MLSDAERAKLSDLQFMLGPDAGALALALEQITDAMAQVNLHTVYFRVEKGPRAGAPSKDVADALETMEKAKDLIQLTLQRLRGSPKTGRAE